MADAGFFRGTSAEQDNRFLDKQKKLLKSMKFSSVLNKKVEMEKVNLDVVKPWITRRITEILGFEDDVVLQFIFNMLEGKNPDPRMLQINITGFLQAKNAREFMKQLWELLVSAQENIGGIPSAFLEKKKEEIKQRKLEQDRIQANIQKHQGELQQPEPDSTADGDTHGPSKEPIEVQVKKAAEVVAATLAENFPPGRDSRKSDKDSDAKQEPASVENKEESPDKTVKSVVASVKLIRTTRRRRRGPLSTAARPADRTKPGWLEEHQQHCVLIGRCNTVVLVGDSIINGLARYARVWQRYCAPFKALNFGLGGDKTQHVLWRLQNGALEGSPKVVVVHCGTNNIDKNYASEISQGILAIVDFIRTKVPWCSVVVVGLLPRDMLHSDRRETIDEVNDDLAEQINFTDEFQNEMVFFLRPERDWILRNGKLNESLYFTDHLHLIEAGDEKLAKFICRLVRELIEAEDKPDESDRTAAKTAIKVKEVQREMEKAEKDEVEKKAQSQSRSPSRSRSRSRGRQRSREKRRKRSPSYSSNSRSRSRSYSPTRSRSPHGKRRRSPSYSPRRQRKFQGNRRSPYRRPPRRSPSPRRRSPSPRRRRSRSPRRRSPSYSPPPRKARRSPSPRRYRPTRPRVRSRSPSASSRSESHSSQSSRSPSPGKEPQKEKKKEEEEVTKSQTTTGSNAQSPPPSHHRSSLKKQEEKSPVRQKTPSPSPVKEVKAKERSKSPPLPKSKKTTSRSYRKHDSSSSSSESEPHIIKKKKSHSPKERKSGRVRSESPRDRKPRRPSPPRQWRRDSRSPARRRRQDSHSPSPPRRGRRFSRSPSPPRRRPMEHSYSPFPPQDKRRRRRSETSPVRRRDARRDSSPPRKPLWDRWRSESSPSRHPANKSEEQVRSRKGCRRSSSPESPIKSNRRKVPAIKLESRAVRRSPSYSPEPPVTQKSSSRKKSPSPSPSEKRSKKKERMSQSVESPVEARRQEVRRSSSSRSPSRSPEPPHKAKYHSPRQSRSPSPPPAKPPAKKLHSQRTPSNSPSPERIVKYQGTKHAPSTHSPEHKRQVQPGKRSASMSPERERSKRKVSRKSPGEESPREPLARSAPTGKSPSVHSEAMEEDKRSESRSPPPKGGSDDEVEQKEEKKKKHKKHKKHASKHKHKHRHKGKKNKDRSAEQPSDSGGEEGDTEKLERNLREKALQSMQKHAKADDESS